MGTGKTARVLTRLLEKQAPQVLATYSRCEAPMALSVGVKCKTCGETIRLPIELPPHHALSEIRVYVPDLDPIPCECGSSHLYGSDDCFEFEPG